MTTEYVATGRSRVEPPITLSADDYQRLSALAHLAKNSLPDRAADLAEEIERAQVLAKGSYPKHIVCMNSEAEFRDDTTGKTRRVTLVYPEDADISQGKISVLTPVGTALIGLEIGHSISWETPNKEIRQLTVLAVNGNRAG
jgi:regulator of nucleoside diphosphate kinase